MTKLFAIFVDPTVEKAPRAVAEKFNWYAFILTPIWAIHRQCWGALIIWLALIAAISGLLMLASFNEFWPSLLVSLWFGFEAPRFEQAKAKSRGLSLQTFGLADNALDAEISALARDEEPA